MTRIPRKAKAAIIVGLVAVLVGAPAGVGYAAYSSDAPTRGLLPKGTVVSGIDVSRLTRDAAIAKVRAAVERDFDRTAVVTVAGKTYTLTQRKLGAGADVEAAVDEVYAAASRGNWLTRAWHRVVDGTDAPRAEVAVTPYDQGRLARIVDDAVKEHTVAPVDADVHESGGWLTFTKARFGHTLDRRATLSAFKWSLKDGRARQVGLMEVAPKTAAVDTAIVVHVGENKLYLYQHGKITKTYSVATGAPQFPTPTGRFEVVLKRYLPTWVNPWSKWSMDEPATIPPGPNNPLGTRAMNLSAPGIRIHGTPADRSIGYSVSHGCIRMHMRDVEALYPLVPQGTPVFLVRVGAPRFPGMSLSNDAANAADGG